MIHSLNTPNLEERFLPPDNWQIKKFKNPETGHDIAYRTALIEKPKAIIYCLPGLSEFGEKYIETARQLNDQGYNIVIIDWAYQGFSTRFQDNPHKRYSDGYDADISDLHHLISEEINSKLPHFILAHSMGGHIALRYTAQHPEKIQALSASAPMANIKGLKYLCEIGCSIFNVLKFIHETYIPGGHDWDPNARLSSGQGIFSSDNIRDEVHKEWCLSNPDLQVGAPTYKWLAESLKSVCALKNKNTIKKITCPVLIACAGQEKLVDNSAIIRIAKYLPDDHLIYIEHAKHEILMETDDIRDQFLDETLKLFNR